MTPVQKPDVELDTNEFTDPHGVRGFVIRVSVDGLPHGVFLTTDPQDVTPDSLAKFAQTYAFAVMSERRHAHFVDLGMTAVKKTIDGQN